MRSIIRLIGVWHKKAVGAWWVWMGSLVLRKNMASQMIEMAGKNCA